MRRAAGSRSQPPDYSPRSSSESSRCRARQTMLSWPLTVAIMRAVGGWRLKGDQGRYIVYSLDTRPEARAVNSTKESYLAPTWAATCSRALSCARARWQPYGRWLGRQGFQGRGCWRGCSRLQVRGPGDGSGKRGKLALRKSHPIRVPLSAWLPGAGGGPEASFSAATLQGGRTRRSAPQKGER
eukprot:2829739-Pleurochrysis_carterae.AAC.1